MWDFWSPTVSFKCSRTNITDDAGVFFKNALAGRWKFAAVVSSQWGLMWYRWTRSSARAENSSIKGSVLEFWTKTHTDDWIYNRRTFTNNNHRNALKPDAVFYVLKIIVMSEIKSLTIQMRRAKRGRLSGSGCAARVQQGVLAHRASSRLTGGRIWRGCWGTALWAQMSASIVGIFSSKPVVDSNTVHLFKAISNMSCLTSFKSYLTPRNSHEFTVRIKEENSQRERNYHFHFVHRCCL